MTEPGTRVVIDPIETGRQIYLRLAEFIDKTRELASREEALPVNWCANPLPRTHVHVWVSPTQVSIRVKFRTAAQGRL